MALLSSVWVQPFSPFSPALTSTIMSRRHRPLYRSASICISLVGTLTNTAIAVQVLTACQNMKWGEVESEWAGDSWIQVADGIKIMCILLSLYFVSAASICAIGLVGVLRVRLVLFQCLINIFNSWSVQNKASLVRLYRDYSIADFFFCVLATLGGSYAAFMSSTRAGICEEFSRHPELMRDMLEMGLNSENCEHWLARAINVLIGAMVVLLVIRVCIIALDDVADLILTGIAAFFTCCIQLLLTAHSSLCSLFIKLLLVVGSSATPFAQWVLGHASTCHSCYTGR